jgi:ABC-2 type transport system permease protein
MNAAWRAELLKVATVRGQWLGGALAAVVIPVLSLLVVATGGLSAGDTVTSGAATGAVGGLLAFGVWAATVAGGEYARHTIVVSLTTVPRRTRLYGAKLAAIGAIATAGAVATALGSWLIVLAAAPSDHAVGNPANLVGIVLAIVAVSVLGAAVGIATRSPSAASAIVVVAILLPKAAGGLLGGLQRWVVGASPGTVVTQLVHGAQLPPDQQYPVGGWAAAVTMLAVAAVVAAIGGLALARRDG